ncbi:cation/H+ exchanger [Vararia minispora EC-137]|uniref:Cation/H+ exchanger n=1 Tax=Vararia minispora EC-137 TaxID=1314806 RepID=A0ACB8QXV2_9AGAM|nr:cation/H+ exchanger [Vararia minispora EC-137]
MGEFSRAFVELGQGLVRRAAAEQSGIFAGLNPATVNSNDPFVLWVIQSIIIIGMTQLLALFLGRIRQPRVISEVIGGVLLGPTVMGRIPGFTNALFPKDSLQYLTLTSTIGLVFFLFLVGLELDIRVVKKNAKASAVISVVGLCVPLGLGAALAVPLYDQFTDPSINRGYFILFVAVAVGITAFPVLCRILTEVKLLDTTVGVLALSAGVGNDVVGWILLALAVALVNASNGLTALYVLLTGIGFVLFLLLPVKWGYKWAARKFGGLDRGEPNALMMTITLIMVLFSAFFTDIIGIHPIFGGFLAGLVIPKVNGYEIALVEKLEDFVSLLLLPQYFILSGLRTNLGLLNNGITWGYTVLICVVAFFAKFISCSFVAKAFGFSIRESGAVGSLMACKGLVELIVLNVGLQAGILNQRVFSMFVLHALVLTFITTPLVLAFYPERVRSGGTTSLEAGLTATPGVALPRDGGQDEEFKSRFSIILDQIEHLPAAMTFAQLVRIAPFGRSTRHRDNSSIAKESADDTLKETEASPRSRPISIDALRLIELSDRTSAVLKSQSADVLIHQDTTLSVMRTYGRLNQLNVSTSLAVLPQEEFANSVVAHARNTDSHMIVVPWAVPHSDITDVDGPPAALTNPFDALFRKSHSTNDDVSPIATSNVIRRIFANSPADVALFIDRGISNKADGLPHFFLPFFGGPDDRLALLLLVQFCHNPAVTATVVRLRTAESVQATADKGGAQLTYGNTLTYPDTVYAQNTQTRLQSDTADNIAWSSYAIASTRSDELGSALRRITFQEETSAKPLHRVLELAGAAASNHSAKPLFVVVGRSRRLAVDSHKQELLQLAQEHNATISSEAPRTFGEVGAAVVASGANVSLVVVQAASS